MERRGIRAYDESSHRDGVRHIYYRSTSLTGACVITLIVSRPPETGALTGLIGDLRRDVPSMSGFVLCRNTARGNTVLSGEFETLWGDGTLTEGLCGLRFSLSPRAFFQVNPPQAEKLYEKALEFAGIREGTLALDLYCGTGTIGLCMAGRGARAKDMTQRIALLRDALRLEAECESEEEYLLRLRRLTKGKCGGECYYPEAGRFI